MTVAPLTVAETRTGESVVKAPAFAVNVPAEAPDAIVMLAGIVNCALSLVNATVVALGAAALSVAVHVADWPGVNVAGAHVTADSAGPAVGGVNLTTAFAVPPFKDAAIWTSVLAATAVAAVAANVADEAPDAIAIVA